MTLTAEKVREIYNYDPDTGVFTWRNDSPKHGPQYKAGDVAGFLRLKRDVKYRLLSIGGKQYYAHRLAWLHHYGELDGQIDHVNMDPTDNRISNLRLATYSQNNANRRMFRNNTSGYRGVYYEKSRGTWAAKIHRDGKLRHIGRYDSPDRAYEAYKKASLEIFGEFSRA